VYYNFFNASKFLICIIFGSLLFFQVRAQEKRSIDSLTLALKNAVNEHEVLDTKVALAFENFYIDNEKALLFSSEAFDLAKQLGDTAQMVMAGRIKGQMLRRFDKLQESIDILIVLAPIAKRNKLYEHHRKILNALALAHTYKADYDKALEYNFEALVACEEQNDRPLMSVILNNIGLVYFKLHNYQQAIQFYSRSLELKREIEDPYDLDMLLINLGLCYNQLDDFQQAQKFFLEALKTCDNNCSHEKLMQGKFGLGVSLFRQEKFGEAVLNFQESYNIATNLKDHRWQSENLVYLGQISTEVRDFESAKKYFLQAEEIAFPAGYSQILIDTYRQFSELYSQVEDFKNATEYQKKYIQLNDSLFSQEMIKNISKVQTNYAERVNIATIASNEFVIKQQRDLNIAVAVIALLAGLLVLVLQFGNRNIKRVNAKLSEAKEVIQIQNQELANKNKDLDHQVEKKTADLARANNSLKQVNDELDNFIYKTSHDIRGPLASLKGMCNVALMDVKDPVALEYLRKLDATAERLNSILTRLVIINQINNSKLSVQPIDFESIISDVLLLEKKKGLPPELIITPQIDENAIIESDRELVRIVMENLIDNAIKFYNDSDRVNSFVKIHINGLDDGSVKVRVIDNGIGISESSPGKLFQMFSRASERSETGGIGLYITKTATEKIGGKVGLLTTPEGYTEFYVVFPPSPFKETELLRASSF
jgi:signal transduction histidine kinase